MFKVIVGGSEGFQDYELLKQRLDFYLQHKKEIIIISGGMKGADELGIRYAREKGYILKQVDTEKDKYGDLAKAKGNERMAQEADACIVFWDGLSPGTANLIENTRKMKLSLKIVRF